MVKVILFDLDGTLLLRKDRNWTRQQFIDWLVMNGVAEPEVVLGHPDWKDRTKRLQLLEITLDEYKKWYENFQYAELDRNKLELSRGRIYLAKGSIKLLKSLKYPKILVSNSSKEWVLFALKRFKLNKYFEFVFERDYCFGRPVKPQIEVKDIIEKAVGKLSSDSIVVGDGERDAEFARNCGFEFVALFKKIEGEKYINSTKDLSCYLQQKGFIK